MKYVLKEAYIRTRKETGIDPLRPGGFKEILVNDAAFETYTESLAESLEDEQIKEEFRTLAESTRINILENSAFNLNPYESLALPILRTFYPKLVSREMVTVKPIDKPDVIIPFIRSSFTPHPYTTNFTAPSINQDISVGPSVLVSGAASAPVPSAAYDVLGNAFSTAYTSDDIHLERDFLITGVSTDGTSWTDTNIVPDVEGYFSATVTIGGATDVISGQVDYLNGTLTVSSTSGVVGFITFTVTSSLEENQVNPRVTLTLDKVRLYARDRQISSEWTINMEQDLRAMFDVSAQAEMVSLIGQQISTDIDREILSALLTANERLNATTHTRSFSKTPAAGYAYGQKYWFENIIPELSHLSGQIYQDTNIGEGNTIACNPLDAAVFESLNNFSYTGTVEKNGDVGYRSATLAAGKWKVLVSSIVDEGQMIMVHKPQEDIKMIYCYAPYVPAVLHPYPLGAIPSLTILTRYATNMVRPNGVAVLDVTA